jgi:hypothetical protein
MDDQAVRAISQRAIPVSSPMLHDPNNVAPLGLGQLIQRKSQLAGYLLLENGTLDIFANCLRIYITVP